MLLMLLSICGCSKTAGQIKKQKEEPVIKVGVAGIAASDSALQRVNEKLGDLSRQKYGFRIELTRVQGKILHFIQMQQKAWISKAFIMQNSKSMPRKGCCLIWHRILTNTDQN